LMEKAFSTEPRNNELQDTRKSGCKERIKTAGQMACARLRAAYTRQFPRGGGIRRLRSLASRANCSGEPRYCIVALRLARNSSCRVLARAFLVIGRRSSTLGLGGADCTILIYISESFFFGDNHSDGKIAVGE
jgi:hypothetical protein